MHRLDARYINFVPLLYHSSPYSDPSVRVAAIRAESNLVRWWFSSCTAAAPYLKFTHAKKFHHVVYQSAHGDVQASVRYTYPSSACAVVPLLLTARDGRARSRGPNRVQHGYSGGKRLRRRGQLRSPLLRPRVTMLCLQTSAWSGQGTWVARWYEGG